MSLSIAYRIAVIKTRISDFRKVISFWDRASAERQKQEGVPRIKRLLRDNLRKLRKLEGNAA